jgi:hypothetical protein
MLSDQSRAIPFDSAVARDSAAWQLTAVAVVTLTEQSPSMETVPPTPEPYPVNVPPIENVVLSIPFEVAVTVGVRCGQLNVLLGSPGLDTVTDVSCVLVGEAPALMGISQSAPLAE